MQILLASLVEDLEIYPRNQIDDQHVITLADALESGAELPPIMADKRTKKIIDGFHRRRAYLRLYGDDAKAEVTLKSYKSEADMFLEAATLNSVHGKIMSSLDRARCIIIAGQFNIELSVLAGTLHCPLSRIEKITGRKIASTVSGKKVPLSITQIFAAGKVLNPKQEEGLEKTRGGNPPLRMINDLIGIFEYDYIPREAPIFEALQRLKLHIDGFLLESAA